MVEPDAQVDEDLLGYSVNVHENEYRQSPLEAKQRAKRLLDERSSAVRPTPQPSMGIENAWRVLLHPPSVPPEMPRSRIVVRSCRTKQLNHRNMERETGIEPATSSLGITL